MKLCDNNIIILCSIDNDNYDDNGTSYRAKNTSELIDTVSILLYDPLTSFTITLFGFYYCQTLEMFPQSGEFLYVTGWGIEN